MDIVPGLIPGTMIPGTAPLRGAIPTAIGAIGEHGALISAGIPASGIPGIMIHSTMIPGMDLTTDGAAITAITAIMDGADPATATSGMERKTRPTAPVPVSPGSATSTPARTVL